jgi:hypothetical protein
LLVVRFFFLLSAAFAATILDLISSLYLEFFVIRLLQYLIYYSFSTSFSSNITCVWNHLGSKDRGLGRWNTASEVYATRIAVFELRDGTSYCLGSVSDVSLVAHNRRQCISDFHSASQHERRLNYQLRYVNITTCQSTQRTKWPSVQLTVDVPTPFPNTVSIKFVGCLQM